VGVHKLTVPLPRMGPEVFLLFAPILAAPIALVALAIHFVARGRFAIRSDGELVLAGLPYSAMLLGLISPWLLALVPLLHPWFWRVLRASRPSQDGER